MVAACLLALAVHALLHHYPIALISDDEAMQIQVEPVLHRRAVHLRHHSAGCRQCRAIETDALADRDEFAWRRPRVFATATADMNSQLAGQRRKSAFERADD